MLPRLNILRRWGHLSRHRKRFSSDTPTPILAAAKVSPQKATDAPAKPLVVPRKERVINLDRPQDMRFPLPGNVGFSLKPSADIIQLSKIPEATSIKELVKECSKSTYIVRGSGERLDFDCFYEKRDPLILASAHMQWEIYNCPTIVKSDFEKLFPHRNLKLNYFTAILFSHKTESDMSLWTEEMDQEREQLGSMFKNAAVELSLRLGEQGFWAEYVDPSSGTMTCSTSMPENQTSAALYETDDRYRHFGLDIQDMGCCKVVNHPRWGSNTFVGTIFTNAPPKLDVLTNLDNFFRKA